MYDVDLKLQPLNVVIGANGCGKTSLLEVFSMLAASASGGLKETTSNLGGIDANLTNLLAAKGDKARFMAFDLTIGVPGQSPIESHRREPSRDGVSSATGQPHAARGSAEGPNMNDHDSANTGHEFRRRPGPFGPAWALLPKGQQPLGIDDTTRSIA